MNLKQQTGLERFISQSYDGIIAADKLYGRISRQDRDLYRVITEKGESKAELTGNLRYTAESIYDLPATGDWVELIEYDSDYLITSLLPRYSFLSRKASGTVVKDQLIAANIDYAIIIQAINNNYNLNRIERYLSVAFAGNVEPVIIFNKTDLVEEHIVNEIRKEAEERFKKIKILFTSFMNQSGYEDLYPVFISGYTYCFMGSSGVGKSSLVNLLMQENRTGVGDISNSTDKGRHITTSRELFVSPEGYIIIDTPGMREIGIRSDDDSLIRTFPEISKLSEECRYNDCSHENEPGCAVLAAVEEGKISQELLRNYFKLKREARHYDSSLLERKKTDKEFGKMVKDVLKHRRNTKY